MNKEIIHKYRVIQQNNAFLIICKTCGVFMASSNDNLNVIQKLCRLNEKYMNINKFGEKNK